MDSETSESDNEMGLTPPNIRKLAVEATNNLIPEKSKKLYEKTYKKFEEYIKDNDIGLITENVLLAYMLEMSKKCKASTLWSNYSMLKTCLNIKRNIDISKYMKLRAFLKKKNVGYVPKKSKTFSRQEIEKFLNDAPDYSYLLHKVVYILGMAGACRREELTYLKENQIQDLNTMLLITVSDNKTHKSRSFTVTGDYLKYYRQYALLRPKNCDRFFLRFEKGKCTKQNVGIHKIGNIPSEIALFLKLPDVKEYTGHCYRRTSATLLADAGANLTVLKRHGGWKSSSVAEGYIDQSLSNKIDIANKILKANGEGSYINPNKEKIKEPTNSLDMNKLQKGIVLNNCSNCTININ